MSNLVNEMIMENISDDIMDMKVEAFLDNITGDDSYNDVMKAIARLIEKKLEETAVHQHLILDNSLSLWYSQPILRD